MASNILFEEVADSANINYVGLSYGAAWGDFNGDIYPDLYVSNHTNAVILYLNQGDGTFENISSQVFSQELEEQIRDTHGAAWADFDNDGDEDLLQLVGAARGTGADPNLLFVNNGEVLEERASELGIDYPLLRGRTPLWQDFDKDGLLDVFVTGFLREEAPPTVFRQTNEGFEEVRSTTNFDIERSYFSLLSDVSRDGNLDAIFSDLFGPNPITVYDTSSLPFEDISDIFQSRPIVPTDIVSGDFNGDLQPDLYLTRNSSQGALSTESDSLQIDSDTIQARILAQEDNKGISFDSSGNVRFNLSYNFNVSSSDIYIGADGFNPSNTNFVLSANDPDVEGISSYTPGADRGVYIGYDSSQEEWQMLVSSPDSLDVNTVINSTNAIANLNATGFNPNDTPASDQLWINTEQGLVDRSEESGINSVPVLGHNVVSGDFNNDMDLDLYVVATGSAANRPNVLYDNQGDGTFEAIADAGGAEGTNLGVGDTVSTADYDSDGFLDLFVTNGARTRNLSVDAPYQLFRNQGNDNNWLEIDLEGVASNRDGIGAQVFVTAGGVTQLREQTGGVHNHSQDHQRLHFGLGDNTNVEEILIEWPDGSEQQINNVSANQLLDVVQSGDFTSENPDDSDGSDSGVFLSKDTFDGPYQLRAVGSEDFTSFEVNLISSEGMLELTPLNLEGDDTLEETEFGFSFNSRLFGGQDGVEFDLAPGSEALISVTQDGENLPPQLQLGSEESLLSADGWILDADEFPELPKYTIGEDLGLFFGLGSSSEELEFRSNGDGNPHQSSLSVLSSEEADFSTVDIEPSDTQIDLGNGITIDGNVNTDSDGVNVIAPESAKIGFTYELDGLLQPDLVNRGLLDEANPNAYSLPSTTPYGEPNYSNSEESAIFLWKDEDAWRLRVTAGTEPNRRFVGSIVADSSATSVEGVKIESNDVVDTSDPTRIDFDLKVWSGFQDGIDFSFSQDANLTLNIDNSGDEAASLLQVGADRWSVNEVPLDLSGW